MQAPADLAGTCRQWNGPGRRRPDVTSSHQEFRAFYAASRDGCLRAVLVSTPDPDLAEDLVAEAFARAWARWPAVRRHPAPAAWVVRTALNTRVSWWRRRRHELPPARDHTDSRGPEQSPALLSGAPSTAPDSAARLETMDVLDVLRDLPERQRHVVALRVFLDLDTRATAEVLGIAEGTVTAHLHRGLQAVREALRPPPSNDVLPQTDTTPHRGPAPSARAMSGVRAETLDHRNGEEVP